MDEPTDEEILAVDGAVVFVEEGFGEILMVRRLAACFLLFVVPIKGFVVAVVEARAVVPFFAVPAFPSQLREVVEGDGWAGVADAGALVTDGAEQDNLAEIVGDIFPPVVVGAEGFAGVAPGVGIRVFFGGIFTVESQAEGFALKVGADVGLGGFSVGGALNGVGHESIFAGTGWKVNAGW